MNRLSDRIGADDLLRGWRKVELPEEIRSKSGRHAANGKGDWIYIHDEEER